MAINQIDTGYKPEFALGAAFAGENAANVAMSNQLEMIKQYLANQKSQQLDPIEIAQAQQTLDSGAYKTRPEYQDAMTDMMVGQGMSNMAAGQTAKGLQPFRQQTEQLDLQRQQGDLRNQAQIQQIDDALNDNEATFQPGVRDKLLQARQSLINRFKETPKFAGQRELTETKTDSAEYIAEMRRQLEEAKAAAKAAQEHPMTMSQMEAMMRKRFADNPNDAEAYKFLKEYERFKQTTQPGMGQVTLNPDDKTLTTVGGNLGNSGGTNDLQAAIMAELKRRQQQGK